MSPHNTIDEMPPAVGPSHAATATAVNGFVSSATGDPVQTDVLIVGAGPSGAGLACFLASSGMKGIMIGAAPGTANTPRAHITNMAALECLRDIGLDRDVEQVSSKGHCMVHTRWCHSMAGEEFARLYSWGNDPKRKGDYETASPCSPADVPQTLLEPILIRHATTNNFSVRFNTRLTSFDRNEATGRIVANVRDEISGLAYKIETKYLFGADGAQSQVVKQLDLPLIRKPGQGVAINVLVKADLSHLVDARKGNLHWVMQPDREHPDFGWIGIIRMVKPWDEWMFILFPTQDWDFKDDGKTSSEDYRQRVREFIGDDTPIEILNVSKWFINEIVAEKYSDGNIHCLGDAVHRHPPMNGLGSNTCIQDAFNLAWKVSYVEKKLAAPSLLDTYSIERQPVGQSIITRANDAFRDHHHIWDTIGTLPPSVEERRKILDELSSATPSGEERRRRFRHVITQTSHEFHGLGVEMGQRYTGPGIYAADEEPFVPAGRAAKDPVLYYEPSTYPGCRLPHVWLDTTIPSKRVSTIDLAGHGAFVLFTGIGGNAWKTAAAAVQQESGVPIKVHSIGFRQDWEDFYFDWQGVRGVEDSGAVLVRPDRFVAWRASRVLDEQACTDKLSLVLKSVLGWI